MNPTLEISTKDNTAQVQSELADNLQAALLAIGNAAVGYIVDQMKSGYNIPHQNRDAEGKVVEGTHTDIRWTGDLMRDVSFELERSKPETVDVGNTLDYAINIHEGTHTMRGRPYIRDACENHAQDIKDIFEAYLSK